MNRFDTIAPEDKFEIEFDEEGASLVFFINDFHEFEVLNVTAAIPEVNPGDIITGANGVPFPEGNRDALRQELEQLLNSNVPVHFDFARLEKEVRSKSGRLTSHSQGSQLEGFQLHLDEGGVIELMIDPVRGLVVASTSPEVLDLQPGDVIIGSNGLVGNLPTTGLHEAMKEIMMTPDTVSFTIEAQDSQFRAVGTRQSVRSKVSTRSGRVSYFRGGAPPPPKDRSGFSEVKKPGDPLPAHEAAKDPVVITRLHVMEYLSGREWWYEGQNALCFTFVLWVIFLLIMYLRAGVEVSYDLHQAVAQHMENIVAHPHLSGIQLRTTDDMPVPCKCACQSSTVGYPSGPCDPHASETIDFLGSLPTGSTRLPNMSHAALQAANIDPASIGDRLGLGNDDIEEVTWNSIVEPKHVWFWVEHGLIPNIWMPRSLMQVSASEDLDAGNVSAGNNSLQGNSLQSNSLQQTGLQGLVASRNLIIGGIRARQERAKLSDDCDKKIDEKMDEFYGMACRGWDDATGSFGSFSALRTAPSGNEPSGNEPGNASSISSASSIGSASSTSSASSTPAPSSTSTDAFEPSKNDARYYDALLDVELPASFALETASFCRKYDWIDGATRRLELKGVALNADVGMFAIVKIHFDFLYGGGVDKHVDVHTIHATGQKLKLTDIIPELIWAGLILMLLRQELSQLAYETCNRRCLEYWLDFWCVVDWVSILVGLAIAAFWFWQISAISSISKDVAALPRAPFAGGFPSDIDMYQEQWQKILDDASSIYERKKYYQLCLFWYTMIITGRFLKAFLSQAKLAMLQLTLGHTFWDVTHLLVFFVVIFMNFMLGGHILFGHVLWDWSTLVKSAGVSLRMLLGDFAFDDMYEIAPVSATIWFWFFLLSMTFILMNFCFAIIGDYFHVFRRSIGATPTIFNDIVVALKEQWWRLGWRRERWRECDDRESCMAACCYSPYYEVLENLMEAAQAPDSLERDSRHSCLGVKLGRRHMEALSVEGLTAANNPGFAEVKENDLQRLGCELFAAEHLLQMTEPMVEIETKLKNESQMTLIRHLVKLLQTHRMELDAHCTELEKDIQFLADADFAEDGRAGLFRYLEDLEDSVKKCLSEFERLKSTGVKSLAPAPHALPRPGTMAAIEMQQSSMVGPGALLRAIENQTQNLLRLPPELPDMMNPNHRNALLMKSPHTEAMIRSRQELMEKPTTSMGATNVTIMLEDNTIPEKFFTAETNRIKAEQEVARREAERLENERRYAEMMAESRPPGQQHDQDLLALEGGQARGPSNDLLRLAASSDQPQALVDIGNEPQQAYRNGATYDSMNDLQPIADRQEAEAFEIRFPEGSVVFEYNMMNQPVVSSVASVGGQSITSMLNISPGDIILEANGQKFPEAIYPMMDNGEAIVEIKFETAEGTSSSACSPGVLIECATRESYRSGEEAPLGW